MENYEELLKKAIEKLPNQMSGSERFEVPNAEVFLQGNRTIIKNFSEICSKLRRDQDKLLKYLSRALAAPANLVSGLAVFQARIPARIIQSKLNAYVKNFVICPVCKRPDTDLIRQGKVWILRCQACGAKNTVK